MGEYIWGGGGSYLEYNLYHLYHSHGNSETFGDYMPENQRVRLIHLLQFVNIVGEPPFRAIDIGVISINSVVELSTLGIEANKSASIKPESTDFVSLRWNNTLAH